MINFLEFCMTCMKTAVQGTLGVILIVISIVLLAKFFGAFKGKDYIVSK